jgi:hypothetical protein
MSAHSLKFTCDGGELIVLYNRPYPRQKTRRAIDEPERFIA